MTDTATTTKPAGDRRWILALASRYGLAVLVYWSHCARRSQVAPARPPHAGLAPRLVGAELVQRGQRTNLR